MKTGIKDIAINGAKKIKDLALQNPDTDWRFEYSPESFTGTELEYAAEVCDAVVEILREVSNHKIIINLMVYNYSIQYNLKYKSYLTALTVFYFLRICLLKIVFHYYYYYYLS